MGIRREARERALQFLFQCDLNPPEDFEAALRAFWERTEKARGKSQADSEEGPSTREAATRLFAEQLIRGVWARREEVDRRIRSLLRNWDLRRLATVDRNVLRLAVHEMLHRMDIPPVVSINEAVEIAKKYSTEDSGKFVNGILDSLRKELMRPARTAEEGAPPEGRS